jgi:hypothetical protein
MNIDTTNTSIVKAEDIVIFCTQSRDGITGDVNNLVFMEDMHEVNPDNPSYYAKKLQDITEEEATAIIISHCLEARQMLEVAGYAHLIKDMDELD